MFFALISHPFHINAQIWVLRIISLQPSMTMNNKTLEILLFICLHFYELQRQQTWAEKWLSKYFRACGPLMVPKAKLICLTSSNLPPTGSLKGGKDFPKALILVAVWDLCGSDISMRLLLAVSMEYAWSF